MKNNPLLKHNIMQDFEISYGRDTNFNMYNYHFHDNYEIVFLLSDNIKYLVGNKLYSVQKGSILVFNNMELHRSVVPAGTLYERYVITFKPEYISDLSTQSTELLDCFHNRNSDFCHFITLNSDDKHKIQNLCERLLFYYSNNEYGVDVYQRLVLAELLLNINSLYNVSTTSEILRRDGAYEKVKPILSYINNHLNEDISLDMLSHVSHISKQHMCFIFKKATGFSVMEYIINLRISKARKLLKKELPVSSVCEMVGFHNISHFIRTFKSLTGTSPKKYAKLY